MSCGIEKLPLARKIRAHPQALSDHSVQAASPQGPVRALFPGPGAIIAIFVSPSVLFGREVAESVNCESTRICQILGRGEGGGR